MTSARDRLASKMSGFSADLKKRIDGAEVARAEAPPTPPASADDIPQTGVARSLFFRDRITALENELKEAKKGRPSPLSISLLDDSPAQVDTKYDETYIQSIVSAWNAGSVPDPVWVRPMPGGRFEIVAGHHRKRAAIYRGLAQIDAIIVELSDDEAYDRVYTSNIVKVRSDFERAMYLAKRFEEGKKSGRFATQAELAQRFSLSEATVARLLRMLDLPKSIRSIVAEAPFCVGAAAVCDVVLPALQQHPELEAEIAGCLKQLAAGTPQSALKGLIQQQIAARSKDTKPKAEATTKSFGPKKTGFTLVQRSDRLMIIPGKEADVRRLSTELQALLSQLSKQANT